MPKNIQTEDMYIDAVRQYGGAIEYIPEQSLTYEICIEAVKNWLPLNIFYNRIPKKYLKPYLYITEVSNNGAALSLVPDKFKTIEMCINAGANVVLAIMYIPKQMKTFSICINAVKNNKLALKFVPNDIINMLCNALNISYL